MTQRRGPNAPHPHVALALRAPSATPAPAGAVRLRSDLADALVAFGDAFHDHVRFEERTLFEAAQRLALSAALDAIAEACRDRPTAEACR